MAAMGMMRQSSPAQPADIPSLSGPAAPAPGLALPSLGGGAQASKRPYILQCDRTTTHVSLVRSAGEPRAWLDETYGLPLLNVSDTGPIDDQKAAAEEIGALAQTLYGELKTREANANPYTLENFATLASARLIPLSDAQRAEENARRNRVSAEFVSGRVSELLLQRSDRLKGKGAVVVADPARRGLEEGVLDAVFACEPAAMLLVSCNPAAFARDLKALVKAGWDVLEVGAFDLFPQTVHLEVMALLTPPEAPELDGRAPQRRMVR